MLVALWACAALGSGQTRKFVRPNDTVTVNCAEEPAISKDYTITRDGFIIMQYAGAVRIGGLSEADAGNKIAQALVSERILSSATVTVSVDGSKPGVVSYMGAVQNSGSLTPRSGMRLSDVVKAANPTPDANLQHVRIVTFAGNVFIVNYAAYNGVNNVNNPEVLSGDSVFFDSGSPQTPGTPLPTGSPTIPTQPTTPVPAPQPPVYNPNPPNSPPVQGPSNPPVYTPQPPQQPTGRVVIVQGAVESPGPVPFHDGITLTGAIQEAGGLFKDSDLGGVTVQRKIDGQMRVYHANVGDIEKGFAGDISLRPGDLVDVPGHGHKGWLTKPVKIGALVLIALIILH
jgi:protein involved in polysaccharide export with SLBB domain